MTVLKTEPRAWACSAFANSSSKRYKKRHPESLVVGEAVIDKTECWIVEDPDGVFRVPVPKLHVLLLAR